VRAFLGIPIPVELAEELSNRIAPLRDDTPGISWVRPEKYHITMLFLGGLRAIKHSRVKSAIDSLHPEGGAEARLGEVGQFPPKGSPRVIYAGLEEGQEFCGTVYRRLCMVLPGYSQSRSYVAHVTLGRVKRGRRVSFNRAVTLPGDPFRLEEIVLYRSILHQSGAEYRRLHSGGL